MQDQEGPSLPMPTLTFVDTEARAGVSAICLRPWSTRTGVSAIGAFLLSGDCGLNIVLFLLLAPLRRRLI